MAHEHPLLRLPSEDLDLILRFVLVSGSLKDLAAEYKVSYPTIRARLDRLIERVQALVQDTPRDPFLELLADSVEVGDVGVPVARQLRQAYLDRLAQLERSGRNE